MVWIDITAPTHDELNQIASRYHINRHIVLDCLDPDHLPKHEPLRHCTFMIVRFFDANVKAHLDSLHEITNKIAVFYNHDFIITVHKNKLPFLESLFTEKEVQNNISTASVVTKILRCTLQSFEQPVVALGEQIDDYETTVLLKHTRPSLLHGLYYIKRKASTCKKVLLLTDDLIHYLKNTETEESAVQDVRDLYTKLLTLYDQVLEDVNNLLGTYLSLTAQKTNEVMKLLTVFSVFFMPLTFIVGIYGMNFKYMPELSARYAYPIVLAVMLLISVAIFIYFKKKKWL